MASYLTQPVKVKLITLMHLSSKEVEKKIRWLVMV